MSQELNCGCGMNVETTQLPVRSIDFSTCGAMTLNVDKEALPGGDYATAGIDYSFEEQWTGKRWVDGKKIYQKTVNFGFLPIKATKDLEHGISSIDTIIECFGFMYGGNQWTHPLPHSSSGDGADVMVGASDTFIRVTTWLDRSMRSAFFTIKYTCTDR